MADRYNVTWTSEAKFQVDQILIYLLENWSEKECKDFLDLLIHFEIDVLPFLHSLNYLKSQKNSKVVDWVLCIDT